MVSYDPISRIENILNVLLCSFVKNDAGISESDGVAFKNLQAAHDRQLVFLEKKALSMLAKIKESNGTGPPFNITEDTIREKFRKTKEKIGQNRQKQRSVFS